MTQHTPRRLVKRMFIGAVSLQRLHPPKVKLSMYEEESKPASTITPCQIKNRVWLIAAFAIAICLVTPAIGVNNYQGQNLREQHPHSTQPSGSQARQNNSALEPDNPDEAMRWRRLSLINEKGEIPPNALMNAAGQREENIAYWQALSKSETAGITPSSWVSRGPQNVGGRTRSLVIHPTNPSILWAGSVSGGVWKSTNGGATWAPTADFMANLAVGCLTIDPANPNVLYCGTGEGFFNTDAVPGAGIFKTTDGGATWNRIASTSSWEMVNRIAIAPTNSNLILAAMQFGGIMRSTNGGATWSNPKVAYTAHQVMFHPTDSNKAVAAIAEGDPHFEIPRTSALYSTNGGATWNASNLNNLAFGFSRIELAYARSAPSIVYASVDSSDGGKVWRSTNGGMTYTKVTTTGATGVGTYTNALWVSPTNPNLIAVGDGALYRSADGGATLTEIAYGGTLEQEAHADMHFLIADPGFDGTANKRVYVCTDGGVFRTDDITTAAHGSGWISLNAGYQTTQYYGAAGHGGTGFVIGGTQDNGTLISPQGNMNASLMSSGDGGFCAVDPSDDAYCYGEYISLQIYRSQDHGMSVQFIDAGIADAGVNANFIAPFILDPNEPNRMLAGGISLWRSNNVRVGNPPDWSSIRPPGTFPLSAIAVATGNSNIIWVGQNDGELYKTTNGLAATPTWITVDDNNAVNPLPNRYPTRILIDPSNANLVYVAFGGFSDGNLQRTTDGGVIWTDVTGTGTSSLPLVPIRGIARHPANQNWLYVGTEVGIFSSDDAGATWSAVGQGPANVSVDELVFTSNSTVLLAATHGRGLWTANVSNPSHIATVGLYNPNGGAFFLRNSNTGGVADITYTYGPAGMGFIPLVGDWDGDGIETIGLYDPAHAGFFLRNSNTGGTADVTFTYGPAGMGFIPLVGDWNGDGVDTIGLYNPAGAAFFLRNSNTGGIADITFTYGPAGMGFVPVVGDWNGDGVDTIGLYNPAGAAFFLRNSNTGGIADITFTYGPAGMGFIALVGDWNTDGVDTVGLYNPAGAAFFLRNSNTGGIADITFTYGPAGMGFKPLAGDWDGL